MKAFARKNGVLFIVLGILLVGAAVLAFSLITTARAETGKQEALVRETGPDATSTPEPSIEDSLFASMLEHRRRTRIPVVDHVSKMERGEWTSASNYDQAEGKEAKAELIRIVGGLFGYTLDAQKLALEYWKDETGHRDDYWRITDEEALVVGCVKAGDLSLLAVDFDVTKAFPPSANAADNTALAQRLTDTLGGNVSSMEEFMTMSSNDSAFAMANLSIFMEDGSCYLMGRYLNTGYDLYAVSAHPNADCMNEHIHWPADAEFSDAYIRVQSPPDFVSGEPEAGDMTRERAISFYQRFVTAANGSPDEQEPAAQFWLDKSGARENYWELSGATANLSVAAKTKRIVYSSINKMDVSDGTPGHALTLVPYAKIEENLEQFYAYARHIMEYCYGSGSVAEISCNAIFDGVGCTIDVETENENSVYEFCFNSGALERIDYYESEEIFWHGYSGWPANFLYENIETGETFFPN